MNRLTLFSTLAALAVASTTRAEYMVNPTENVPIERLVANVEKQIARNPEDAQWHYTLGRLHSMIAVGIRDWATPKGEGAEPLPFFDTFGSDFSWRPRIGANQAKPDDAAAHFTKAIDSYKKTIQLQVGHLYAWMGLAWCSEQIGNKDAAIVAYRKAFDLAWEKEKDPKGLYAGSSITVEAGNCLLRLLPAEEATKKERAAIQKRVDTINAKPMWITPIILPVGEELALDALTGCDRETAPTAVFDLAGHGTPQRWEWITRKAAFLVSDPNHTGRVTSGRQLFGSSSWWIMWPDGYTALSALDDNMDGVLAGAELDGISVWHDANENGVSDPGEVSTVASWGIRSIGCRPRTMEGGCLADPEGVMMMDGSVRPTYDWLPRRLE